MRGQISLNRSRITFQGIPNKTMFRMLGSTSNMIRVTADNFQIKDICIDYSGFTGTGSTHAIIGVGIEDILIEDCRFEGLLSGCFQWQQTNKRVILRRNTIMCPDVSLSSTLFAFGSCEDSIVEGNNFIGGGNIIQSGGVRNRFENNYFENAATVSSTNALNFIGADCCIIRGNRFVSTTMNGRAIHLSSSAVNNIVENNHITNFNTGINLSNSNRNLISNNFVVRGAGLSSDYTATQQTITVTDSNCFNNMVIGNLVLGKAVTSNSTTGTTHTNNHVAGNFTGGLGHHPPPAI